MAEYKYSRELITSGEHIGLWNINNPDRVDSEGNQIYLSKEVEEKLCDKRFILECSGDEAVFIFDKELIAQEKEVLDKIVSNHKNNN